MSIIHMSSSQAVTTYSPLGNLRWILSVTRRRRCRRSNLRSRSSRKNSISDGASCPNMLPHAPPYTTCHAPRITARKCARKHTHTHTHTNTHTHAHTHTHTHTHKHTHAHTHTHTHTHTRTHTHSHTHTHARTHAHTHMNKNRHGLRVFRLALGSDLLSSCLTCCHFASLAHACMVFELACACVKCQAKLKSRRKQAQRLLPQASPSNVWKHTGKAQSAKCQGITPRRSTKKKPFK